MTPMFADLSREQWRLRWHVRSLILLFFQRPPGRQRLPGSFHSQFRLVASGGIGAVERSVGSAGSLRSVSPLSVGPGPRGSGR